MSHIYGYLTWFFLENALHSGDHVSWHSPLDQTRSAAGQYNCNPSHIQHMLMVDDPQIPPVAGPLGSVRFIQVAMLKLIICDNNKAIIIIFAYVCYTTKLHLTVWTKTFTTLSSNLTPFLDSTSHVASSVHTTHPQTIAPNGRSGASQGKIINIPRHLLTQWKTFQCKKN